MYELGKQHPYAMSGIAYGAFAAGSGSMPRPTGWESQANGMSTFTHGDIATWSSTHTALSAETYLEGLALFAEVDLVIKKVSGLIRKTVEFGVSGPQVSVELFRTRFLDETA